MKTRMVLSLAASVLILLAGCSTTMTKAPKQEYWNKVQYSECTQSPAQPIVDSVVGSLLVTSGVYGLSNPLNPSLDVPGQEGEARLPAIRKGAQAASVAAVASGVIFYGSAAYGYFMSTRCAKFRQEKLK